MKIPEKGQEVLIEKLIALARFHEKFDIVDAIQASLPPKVFVSDGCSMWPDSWLCGDIYTACFWHDVRYWCGAPGDEVARLIADAELAKDVAILTGNQILARTMFNGAGVGGTDKLKTSFRWGYGR